MIAHFVTAPFLLRIILFPFDGARRLGGDVVNDAVDSCHFVADSSGHFVEDFPREAEVISSHAIRACYSADAYGAMPSSFGLWFGAYAESLVDDLTVMQAAYRICNRNPLGSAAGYGSSFPLNRTMTTRLLGFDSMDYNVVYAQMGRGKTERIVASAMGSIAATLSKLAFDACLFNSQNFGFIKLPDEYTTGSSIMPHKKNPDVFELTRAKCNKIQALPYQITLISNNLPSGYFRDLQIIKEVFLPAFDELKECLRMVTEMMSHMTVNTHILDDDKYKLIFSVEEVNRLTLSGVPFRDAYKQVGLSIEAGTFEPDKHVQHTHEGSIGNLCNDRISLLKQQVIDGFDFNKIETAEAALLGKS